LTAAPYILTTESEKGVGCLGNIVDAAITIVVSPVTNFHGNGGTPAAGILHPFIHLSVTVIVDFVTHFVWDWATGPTRIAYLLVDETITVVIVSIAAFWWRRPADTTGVEHAFVDNAVTIIIDPITDFGGDRFGQNSTECCAEAGLIIGPKCTAVVTPALSRDVI